MGTAVALVGLLGCGGQTGGTPSGIAGALTNATIRVSSFTLSTTSPFNDLVAVADGTTNPVGVTGVDGALFPTRNSHSFRVLLKGAGSNREDVIYYFDSYDPTRTYTPHTPTDAQPWDLEEPAHDGLPRTELRKIYFAEPTVHTSPRVVVAVIKRPSDGVFLYDSDKTPVTTEPVYTAKEGAFSYSQISYRPAVRTGRRNVIVQFFSTDATKDKTEYDTTIPQDPNPSGAETSFLASSLTNSYVFSTNVPAKTAEISLTGSFEANNGDNGLVDTGSLDIVAKNLPARWGSVKFEAYEENYGFGTPSIQFTKIVNLSDVVADPDPSGPGTAFTRIVQGGGRAPATCEAQLAFANRQRVLRIYATCYELPNATGAVLAQTLQDDKKNGNGVLDDSLDTYNDAAGLYPVQFISTPRAKAEYFFPTPGPTTMDGAVPEAEKALQNMVLTPAISEVVATIPDIAKGDSETISVRGTDSQHPRYAYNETPKARPPSQSVTLSDLGFLFSIVAKADDDGNAYFPNVPPVTTPPTPARSNPLTGPTPPTATNPGTLTWLLTETATQFSQTTYGTKQTVTLLEYLSYYPADPMAPYTTLLATLLPTQGTGGGVIRGVKR